MLERQKKYQEVQKILKDHGIPEFPFIMNKENLPAETRDYFIELEQLVLNEVANGSNNIPNIVNTIFSEEECNLEEIKKLLKPFEPIKLTDDRYVGNASVASFKTAGGNEIGTNENAVSSKKSKETSTSNNNTNNLDENIISRIKSEIVSSVTDVTWDSVVGLDLIKKTINEIIVWPILRPDLFTGLRGPIKGLLLFGPPGTGKTMIGKCVASQIKATFFSISASSLTSKWMGESEKMVRVLFHLARQESPSVIFIDEIDSLLSQRSDGENEGSRRIKTEFLVQFDGVTADDSKQVLVIGATNRPQEIDEAARRRLTKRIFVPLPNDASRKTMVTQLLEKYKHTIENEDSLKISELTRGYSGSDIYNLCREAAYEPLREIADISSLKSQDLREIGIEDFIKASSQIRKSVSTEDQKMYDEWNFEYGSKVT